MTDQAYFEYQEKISAAETAEDLAKLQKEIATKEEDPDDDEDVATLFETIAQAAVELEARGK